MIDRVEAARRGRSQPRKRETTHPFSMLQHRVIDSEAFADLKSSAKVLVMLLVRQDNGKNNGHLQVTFSWCKRYGIGSEHTLKGAIADLIAHGFIYRTRSHGANGTWATYALTDRQISDKQGLFLGGWKQNAWHDWKPSEKKATRKKCRKPPAESAVSPPTFQQKMQEAGGQKVQTMNISAIGSEETALGSERAIQKLRAPLYTSPNLIRRQTTADRGQLRVLH